MWVIFMQCSMECVLSKSAQACREFGGAMCYLSGVLGAHSGSAGHKPGEVSQRPDLAVPRRGEQHRQHLWQMFGLHVSD